MKIFFEQHQYDASYVKDDLKDICALQDVDKKISVGYVGYYYSPDSKDCVFILPKVLLEDVDGNEVVANVITKDNDGKDRPVTPEEIITPKGQEKFLSETYRKFLYEFAVWIYQALSVYRKNTGSKAVYYRKLPQEGNGRRHMGETFLDIVLSLIRFNKENQNFFTFIIKNQHSGMNKINWTRTIARSSAIIQKDSVVYLNPVNKKRQVNFDEEIFIIFFSILNHLNETFGFRTPINCQYDLIQGEQFKHLMKSGRGKRWLKQIKYKYFSDKMLRMWDLCYAFFDESHRIAVNTEQKEYLLAKSFEHVFEAMIDELIGDRENVPKRLMEQADGKRVDHMYAYHALTSDNDQTDKLIYYIGDSKYYKAHHNLGEESIYKQYTYARNVIQWNIDLFMDGQRKGWTKEEIEDYNERYNEYGKIRLRNDYEDPLTEGYNVIPNFFLSAFVYDDRKYVAQENIRPHDGEQTHFTCQFPDRLFDRDTLILSHYDVNFLYVLYLYARDKRSEKEAWQRKVREKFRDEIRGVLQKNYHFFALKSKGNLLAGEEFIREHFKELQGKLYRPYGDPHLFALALERKDGVNPEESDTYQLLQDFFVIEEVNNLGDNPTENVDSKVAAYQAEHPYQHIPQQWLPRYYVGRYLNDCFVVGLYHDQAHWDWITGKNDKGTLIYNVRLDPSREGAQKKTTLRAMKPKFAILYEKGKENEYHVFRIHDTAVMTKERMIKALYPREPKGDYFIFRFDEEVNIGKFNIYKLLHESKLKPDEPHFPTGGELMKYKM